MFVFIFFYTDVHSGEIFNVAKAVHGYRASARREPTLHVGKPHRNDHPGLLETLTKKTSDR